MFIECIEIKNLFAYYGLNEIRFLKKQSKNVYCIYGENGFGKTSFIRCAKLLFLGSGLNDYETHEVISRFSKKRVNKPTDFVEGNKNWRGILNDRAKSEGESDYYVCFYGKINNQSFRIKRSWELNGRDITESVEYKRGDEIFYDEDAQEKINIILPPKFVEFFFFDGEEIESIGDNLKTSLRDRIIDIFKISSLEEIIKQSKKIQKDLRTDALENEEKREDYIAKNNELESARRIQTLIEKEINLQNTQIEENDKKIREIENKKSKILEDESQKIKELNIKKNELEAQYAQNKKELPLLLKDVIFLSNKDLLQILEEKICDFENQTSTSDISSLCRLLPEIKDIFSQNFTQGEIHHILEVCDKLPNELEKRVSNSQFYIPHSKINQIKQTIFKYKDDKLSGIISHLRNLKIELEETKEEIKQSNDDDIARIRIQQLDEECESCQDALKEAREKLDEAKSERTDINRKIETLAYEISTIEVGIDTERIEKKIQILDQIIVSIEKYKDRLIAILKVELKDKILENYKKLIPNDNVGSLEITEDFDILLKDFQQNEVFVSNQSSGQRQILAISIFWALKEISKSDMPLIIDTPLSRIDLKNRRNIITQYYANASHQVIILPHSGEMGREEYEMAQPYIADIYKISNDKNRNQARITECDFYEAIKE